jgi:hypothetical protein
MKNIQDRAIMTLVSIYVISTITMAMIYSIHLEYKNTIICIDSGGLPLYIYGIMECVVDDEQLFKPSGEGLG